MVQTWCPSWRAGSDAYMRIIAEGARSSHGQRGANDSDGVGLDRRDAKKVADDVVGEHQQQDDEERDDERRVLATEGQ